MPNGKAEIDRHMYKKLHWMIETGIYDLWPKWSKILIGDPTTLEVDKMEEDINWYISLPRKLTLDLNILSIFYYIYAITIFVSLLGVIVELIVFKVR